MMTALQYTIVDALEAGEIQQRYFEAEIRIEQDRVLSGVAMPYGTEAVLPWGERESFDPGAFGDLSRADVTLNVMHDRARPLVRTGGGGLTIEDSRGELRLRAEIPEHTDGNDALILVNKRVYRGFSVSFVPEKWRYDDKTRKITHETAMLTRIALVDKPAYSQAKVDRRMAMDEHEARIAELVKAEIEKHRSADSADFDATAVAGSVMAGMKGMVEERAAAVAQERVAAALKERDDAAEAQRAAEESRKETEAKAESDRAQAETDAENRAHLLVMLAPLLPDGTQTRGQSNHALMVAAGGGEIADAENRSEDYLMAKLEDILERRNAVSQGGGSASLSQPREAQGAGPLNIIGMIERRRMSETGRA